ncbi:hypothetical protein ABT160_41860 [Streptomyces sp. NPDC001941]|uniref:hypothetical protein n=1 Tax=Streptomyces sp. NPDC001941 TaxID=3154659 RepID=UPI0033172EA8
MGTGRARRVVSAAAVLALVTLTAGCEDDDAGTGADKPAAASPSTGAAAKPSVSKPPSEPPKPLPTADPALGGKTLDKTQLGKVAVADGEVANFSVAALQGGEDTGTERAEQPECQPLAAVINGAPEPAPAATVFRTAMDKSEEGRDDQSVVTLILTSHRGSGAQQLMTSVRTAARACAGGFRTTGGDGPSTYSEVRELPTAGPGEDAFTYQVTGAVEGNKVPLVFHLVRKGSTVVTFYTGNFVDAKTPALPASLVTAQTAKLP